MIKTMENMSEKEFVDLTAEYPDNYLLVTVTVKDYEKGVEAGILVALGDTEDEMWDYRTNNNLRKCVVLTGINRDNFIGSSSLFRGENLCR